MSVLDKRFLATSVGTLNPKVPIEVLTTTTVAEAVALLQANKQGSVIVVDERGLLQGIFTERDVLLKVALRGIDPRATPVSELMTKNPETISATTPIAFALNMMSHGGYRHLPMLDEAGYPIGVVSVKDLVDHIAKMVGDV
jgi:CBS domain-containing protein